MSETFWVSFGMLGQTIFMSRFLVQWLKSEREQRSVIPVAFWYLSLAGGAMLLTYAIHQRDTVFIFGQSFGAVVYVRNLHLIHSQRRREQMEAAERERLETLAAVGEQTTEPAQVLSLPTARSRSRAA
jgi:lipid-A-disaccharide synthase-like uncharacterized protein